MSKSLFGFFSNRTTSERIDKLSEKDNFEYLPPIIQETISTEIVGNELYKLGFTHGKNLCDSSIQVNAIEKKYDAFLEILENDTEEETKEAEVRVEFLETEIDKLLYETDRLIDGSEINKLINRIEEIDRKTESYHERIYEDFHYRKYYEIAKKDFEQEESYLKNLLEQEKETISLLKDKVNDIKNTLEAKTSNNSNQTNNKLKEIQDKIREYVLITEEIDNLDKKYKQIIDRKRDEISSRFNGLQKILRISKPLIWIRGQIISYYLISLILLTGEFYLVFTFLSQTLGVRIPSNLTSLINNPITSFFAILFCLAFPLGIGMLIKIFYKTFESEERKEKLRKITRRVIKVTLIGLVAIAVPNALEIVGIDDTDREFLDIIKVITLWIFLPILTLTLSYVGSIIFLDAIELHIQYHNVKRKSLLAKESKYFDYLNSTKQEVKSKIDDLNDQKKNITEELTNNKAKLLANKKNYSALVENLKETAVSKYLAGFEEGLSLAMQADFDELDIVIHNYKYKIANSKK